MKLNLRILILSIFIGTASFSFGQCDTIADLCAKHLTSEFVSDGQSYRALLRTEEIAEFDITMYGGSKYRLSACSGFTDGNLVFTVLDKERNVMFSNNEYEMAPYWDFEVANTFDAIIEATLKPGDAESGCAVLLIGFQQ